MKGNLLGVQIPRRTLLTEVSLTPAEPKRGNKFDSGKRQWFGAQFVGDPESATGLAGHGHCRPVVD